MEGLQTECSYRLQKVGGNILAMVQEKTNRSSFSKIEMPSLNIMEGFSFLYLMH